MPASSTALAVRRCLSVTFVHSVKMNKHIFRIFSPSGSHTILVFPYQTAWQYFDGNPLNRGVECMRGRLKSQFSTNIWLHRGCISHLRLAFCLMRVLDHQVPHAVTHSARLTKRCLAVYTTANRVHDSNLRLDVTPNRRQQSTEQNQILRTGKLTNNKQEVKVIGQKAPHGGPIIPRLGVTPGGRNLYHWIPGIGFPISVP